MTLSSSRTPWSSREQEVLSRGLNLPEGEFPPLIQRFLLARGFDDLKEIEAFLSPKLADLTNPLSMRGMAEAVSRLYQAYVKKEKVCIYADFDLDGTSGLALLFEGLTTLGFTELVYYQPKRLAEGYGFHATAVEELAQQGVKLIVTVDVGTTAFEACARAQELAVEVIVTDHHQPGDRLPEAKVLINPNIPGDESGLGYLCGAGVAFYLLRAMKRKLVEVGLVSETCLDLRSVLGFFTIGTLTDLVPLVKDNRVLVKHGLLTLEKTKRPGLRALLRSLNLEGRPLTSQDVAIRFSPKLNALSRMEKGILPIDLFFVKDEDLARQMVETVLANNSSRVNLQQAGEQEAFEQLKSWNESKFVFVSSKSFHRGVIGLIATRLNQNLGVPAFVAAESEEGILVGSARGLGHGAANVLEALEGARSVLTRFGGHPVAAGFELRAEGRESFIQRLKEHFSSFLAEQKPREVAYDLSASFSDLSDNLMRWLEALGPFGQSFPTPLFAFHSLELRDWQDLKGGHKKMILMEPRSRRQMEGLYFSPPPAWPFSKGTPVLLDVLGEPQWNYYAGRRTLQILIRDWRLVPLEQREEVLPTI